MRRASSLFAVIVLGSGLMLWGAAQAALLEGDDARWTKQEYKELPAKEADMAQLYLTRADSLRLSWERLLTEERMAPTGRNTRDTIIGRYDNLIDRWPETQYAAQAQYRILTMYGNTLDMTRVQHAYNKLIRHFPHSQYAMDAHLLVGLLYLETLKRPERAVRYFEAVPNPQTEGQNTADAGESTAAEGGESETSARQRRLTPLEEYHLNAQIHLVKCHVYLKEIPQAERIIDNLKKRYPEQAERIDTAFVAIKADVEDIEEERRGIQRLLRILRQ